MPTRTWLASYYDAEGRRHRKTFAIKAEADKWESEGKAATAEAKAAKLKKNVQRAVVAIQASAEAKGK